MLRKSPADWRYLFLLAAVCCALRPAAASNDAAAAASDLFVAPGREDMLADMRCRGAALPDGCAFTCGDIVASIPQVCGSDEVWFNSGDDRYYLAARNNPGGPVLGIVDAETNVWIQNAPTSPNSHSVAADPRSNRIYVPLTAGTTSPCVRGCIGVFEDTDQ
jgi:hypothetical protein